MFEFFSSKLSSQVCLSTSGQVQTWMTRLLIKSLLIGFWFCSETGSGLTHNTEADINRKLLEKGKSQKGKVGPTRSRRYECEEVGKAHRCGHRGRSEGDRLGCALESNRWEWIEGAKSRWVLRQNQRAGARRGGVDRVLGLQWQDEEKDKWTSEGRSHALCYTLCCQD